MTSGEISKVLFFLPAEPGWVSFAIYSFIARPIRGWCVARWEKKVRVKANI
jgi:hypothetical protein